MRGWIWLGVAAGLAAVALLVRDDGGGGRGVRDDPERPPGPRPDPGALPDGRARAGSGRFRARAPRPLVEQRGSPDALPPLAHADPELEPGRAVRGRVPVTPATASGGEASFRPVVPDAPEVLEPSDEDTPAASSGASGPAAPTPPRIRRRR